MDQYKRNSQTALKLQCSTQPLREKGSSWAISAIMAAHVLGGLDQQWLWWHVGSMDNEDQSSTVAELKDVLNNFNQVTERIQRLFSLIKS